MEGGGGCNPSRLDEQLGCTPQKRSLGPVARGRYGANKNLMRDTNLLDFARQMQQPVIDR